MASLVSKQKFILQSSYERKREPPFPPTYTPFDLGAAPRDFILSPRLSAARRETVCIFPRALQTERSGYESVEMDAAASSTSAEFAEGAEKRTREGVAVVIGTVIRHNTEPVSSRVLSGVEGYREERGGGEMRRGKEPDVQNFRCRWPRSSCCF